MRLIDAENFSKAMKDYFTDMITHHKYNVDCVDCNANLQHLLDEQPTTTYDVDKVVAELEENAGRYTKKYVTPYGNNGYRDTKAISIHKAIEIVKQGGVSDDVCEYRITDKMVYASCNNKQIASAFCWFNECGDYKYCPYCGKRIKVVE